VYYDSEDLSDEKIRERIEGRVAALCPKDVYVATDRDANSNAFLICRDTVSGRQLLTTIPALWIEFDEWTRVIDRLRGVCDGL
jgi:hypothetical protein